MASNRNKKSTTSKSRSAKVSQSEISQIELIKSVARVNLDGHTINRQSGSATGLVRDIVSFDDGSHLYRYSDNVEIVSNRFGVSKIKGRFVSTKERGESVIFTFEDDADMLLRLEKESDIAEGHRAADELWQISARLESELRDPKSLDETRKEVALQLDRITLERRAIDARIILLDELDQNHCADRSLHEFFTDASIENAGHTGSKREWSSSKGEFASHVVSQYQEDMGRSSQEKRYKDLKDATEKLFHEHSFPARWRWTSKKCYNYVLKVPRVKKAENIRK